MDNLSTTTITDMTSQIGALELGEHLESHGDDVLEAAGVTALGTAPTQLQLSTRCCPISDGALEAAGANMGWGPPTHVSLGNCTVLAGCVLSPPPR
jgi:hypothetical protein